MSVVNLNEHKNVKLKEQQQKDKLVHKQRVRLAERLAAQEYAAAARHLMKELAKGGVRAEIARREWAEYEEMQRNDS
jgi:hypothetical protein